MPAQLFSEFSNPLASVAQNRVQDRAQMAQYAIMQAAGFLQDNRREEAITAFKQALALDPQNTTASTYIGNISLALGKSDDAIAAFKNLVRQQPNSSDAHIKLGNAYITNEQYDLSEAEFKTAARLDPSNPLPDYTLGMQYLQTGRTNEAEAQFLKVQRMSPGDPNAYYALGATANAQKKYDQAIDYLNTSLSIRPNNPAANYELGVAHASLGNKESAAAQLKTLVEAGSVLANDLQFAINTPSMLWIDGNTSTFNTSLKAGSEVWFQDTGLLTADANTTLSVDIQFAGPMDVASVMNPTNWSISRANSTAAGYYNNLIPTTPSKEAQIAPVPLSVTYNSVSMIARVSFSLSQNSDINATIDPSHIVFKFSGVDAYGRKMDTSADEIDGYASGAF